MISTKKLKLIKLAAIVATAYILFFAASQTSEETIGQEKKFLSSDYLMQGSASLKEPLLRATAASPLRFFDTARGYYPNAKIKPQLPILRDAADNGDSYAACVLATALILCAKKDDDSLLSRYPSSYLTSLTEKELGSLAASAVSYESKKNNICNGMTDYDFEDINERIYQAASYSNPRAMRIFAMHSNAWGNPSHSDKRDYVLTDERRDLSEEMLNNAADSGDPDALLIINSVYLVGSIHTPYGSRIEVVKDPVKAIAAFSALESVNAYQLKSRLYKSDLEDIRLSLNREFENLSENDKNRLKKMEDIYRNAYLIKSRESSIKDDLLNEFPEKSCSEVQKNPSSV